MSHKKSQKKSPEFRLDFENSFMFQKLIEMAPEHVGPDQALIKAEYEDIKLGYTMIAICEKVGHHSMADEVRQRVAKAEVALTKKVMKFTKNKLIDVLVYLRTKKKPMEKIG